MTERAATERRADADGRPEGSDGDGTEALDRVEGPPVTESSPRGRGRGAAVLGAAAAGVGAIAGAVAGRYRRSGNRQDTEHQDTEHQDTEHQDTEHQDTEHPGADRSGEEGAAPSRPDAPAAPAPAPARAEEQARSVGAAPAPSADATTETATRETSAGTPAAAPSASAPAAATPTRTTDTPTPAAEPTSRISEAPTTPSRPAVGKADLAAGAAGAAGAGGAGTTVAPESAAERTEITPAERTDVMSPVEEPRPTTHPRPGVVRDRRRRRRVLFAFVLAALVLAAFLGLVALITDHGDGPAPPRAAATNPAITVPPSPNAPPAPPPVPQLPRGGTTYFPQHRVVAYYGTAGTGSLGVLGEGSPTEAAAKLEAAAAPFATPGKTVLPAMELIVGVANSTPGPDGTYHSDIDEAQARTYLAAARAKQQAMIIDVQPGRADFMTAVRPWENLLREPDVSLALDPEWRMAANEVPGKVIGSVGADEINRVSSWLADLVTRNNLPQKLFVYHQFTPDEIGNPERIATPPQLAVVQHIDGFGAPPNKLGKYKELQRPQQVHLGFKLFYTEDTPMLTPAQALALAPVPDLITYQ